MFQEDAIDKEDVENGEPIISELDGEKYILIVSANGEKKIKLHSWFRFDKLCQQGLGDKNNGL